MRLVKTIFSVFFIYISIFIVSGQSSKIDSLKLSLKNHPESDTVKVNLLNNLAYEFRLHDLQKAKSYAKSSGELSNKLNYQKGKAASLWITGILIRHNDKKAALEYFRKALKIAEDIDDKEGQCNYLIAIGNVVKQWGDTKTSIDSYNKALLKAQELDDKKLIIKVLINVARNKMRSGNHVEAIKQLQEVIQIAKEIDYKEVLARAYADMGLIYNIRGDYPTALDYHLSSLGINEKRNDYIGVYDNLINIADIQSSQNDFDEALITHKKAQKLATGKRDSMRMALSFNYLGNIFRRSNNPEALSYFQKSLSMSKFSTLTQNINNLINIGSIYTEESEYENAMRNFNEALKLAKQANIKRLFGKIYSQIGILHLKQRKYTQAKENAQKALNFAEQTHFTDLQRDCKKLLSDIYAQTGNFKEAYYSQIEYKTLCDSLFNEKNTRKIALLESSYKFAKELEVYDLEKEGNELRIKNQQQTILSLVFLSLFVISIAIAIYWFGRLRKKVLNLKIEKINQELEDNQKAMAVAKLKLIQNSERNANHVKKLEDIEKNTSSDEQKNLSSLINNYKLQTNHSNWEEFETLFTKVNSSFWDRLNKMYPTLTPNERKLCAFLKLNMSNKDIALITYQTEEALKKSRLRLRRKLDLDRSTSLATFIQNI